MTRLPLSVLIVDDQEIARTVVARIVEALGHRVAVASGGAEALDLADRETFDCAVIDRRMPDMDGAALALAFRATSGPRRLVALSGDDPSDMPPGVFDVVLQKPVDVRGLDQALRAA